MAQLDFTVRVSSVDETPLAGETPQAMVERLARLKARAVADQYPDAGVLGADTTVSLNGAILGKPESTDEARSMLQRISGTTHEVWTAIAVVHTSTGREVSGAFCSLVTMVPLSSADIDWYLSTGEPMDKAGAYAVQGLGGQFVRGIQGSFSNVVGLDLVESIRMLSDIGALKAPTR